MTNLFEQLMAVFERRGFFPEGEPEGDFTSRRGRTELIARSIAAIGAGPSAAQNITHMFSSNVSPKTVAGDLRTLQRHLEAVIKILTDKLHVPHIQALGQFPLRQPDGVQELATYAARARHAADEIEDGLWSWNEHFVAKDRRPRVIAAIVIRAYEDILGGSADLPADVPGGCPGLKPLVQEIYGVIGMSADANNHVERALEERSSAARSGVQGASTLPPKRSQRRR